MFAICQKAHKEDGFSGLCFDIFLREDYVSYVSKERPTENFTMRYTYRNYLYSFTHRF